MNSWQERSRTRRANASRRPRQLAFRPTIGRREAPLAARRAPPSRRIAGTGSAFPSARAADGSPTSTAARTSRSVASPIRISPGAAACSSRAATFTASPVASRSSVPVTTSPVLTPIRPVDAELGQRVAHLDRRAARPQRVVLVHDRNAEDRHHRVADELLHRAAVRLDDPLHPLEVARQQRPQRLRVGDSPSAVDPVTSQKTTVTVLRISRGAAATERRAAVGQNASSGSPVRNSRKSAQAETTHRNTPAKGRRGAVIDVHN